METIFELITNDTKLREGLKFITDLAKEVAKLRIENNNKDKTIESLVKDKYTKYGDGYGFLATDALGQKVWVNSINIALEQKDEEIKELWAKIEKLQEKSQ